MSGVWIDGDDRLLPELHVGLRNVAVVQPHVIERFASEHHVELREPEDERVVLVDEGHAYVVGELLGEASRQLEATESGSEYHHVCRHARDVRRVPLGRCGRSTGWAMIW